MPTNLVWNSEIYQKQLFQIKESLIHQSFNHTSKIKSLLSLSSLKAKIHQPPYLELSLHNFPQIQQPKEKTKQISTHLHLDAMAADPSQNDKVRTLYSS